MTDRTKRVIPSMNVTLSEEIVEFIESQREENGLTASAVVRMAMNFYIKHQIAPAIQQKLVNQKIAEELRALKKAQRKIEKGEGEKPVRRKLKEAA